MYGVVRAVGEAVEAYHASRGVDGVVGEVDAACLAGVLAFAALYASVGVDVDLEYGVSADESEGGATPGREAMMRVAMMDDVTEAVTVTAVMWEVMPIPSRADVTMDRSGARKLPHTRQ